MRDAPLKSRSGNFPLNGSVFVTGLTGSTLLGAYLKRKHTVSLIAHTRMEKNSLLRDAGKSSADAGDAGRREDDGPAHRICVEYVKVKGTSGACVCVSDRSWSHVPRFLEKTSFFWKTSVILSHKDTINFLDDSYHRVVKLAGTVTRSL